MQNDNRSDNQSLFPLGLELHEISRAVRREYAARARRLGLSEGQYRALWHLWCNQGISQARLAERLEIQPIALVRVLDRLEALGLIERRPDPKDRRAVQLYLLPSAVPLLEQLRQSGHEIQAMAMAGLSTRTVTRTVAAGAAVNQSRLIAAGQGAGGRLTTTSPR